MTFDSIIGFILLFGLLVFLHELGHFVVAKWCRIHVEVFSLGFGPRLFGWRGPQTDYRVSLVPLGGYVKMLGEGPEAEWVDDPRHREPEAGAEEARDASDADGAGTSGATGDSFLSKTRGQRFLVMVAGAAMNLLLAVGILTGLNMAGRREPAYVDLPPRVAAVVPGSPAEDAGLERGDAIVAVDGEVVESWPELQQAIFLRPGETLELTVVRDGRRLVLPVEVALAPEESPQHKYRVGWIGLGEPAFDVRVWAVVPGAPAEEAGFQVGDLMLAIDGEPVLNDRHVVQLVEARPGQPTTFRIRRGDEELTLTATPADENGKGKIGLSPGATVIVRQYAPWPAFKESLRQNVENADLLFDVLGRLVTFRLSMRAVSGPVEIFSFSGEALRQGWYAFFSLMALFSLQLGILNLLPIPFLDGGHIAILAIEGIIRRDLSEVLKERLLQAGFVFLLLFMGLVIYFDIIKWVGW